MYSFSSYMPNFFARRPHSITCVDRRFTIACMLNPPSIAFPTFLAHWFVFLLSLRLPTTIARLTVVRFLLLSSLSHHTPSATILFSLSPLVFSTTQLHLAHTLTTRLPPMFLAYRCPVNSCTKECKSSRGLMQHVNSFHRQQSPTSGPGESSSPTSTRWTHPTLTGKQLFVLSSIV